MACVQPRQSLPTKTVGLQSFHTSFAAMTLSAETLIKNASQTEKTLVSKDFSHLNNLSSSVTLHQDGFTLNKDVEGEEAVKKYLAAYFDKYDYTHETLMYAVNEKTKASFALALDKVGARHLDNHAPSSIGDLLQVHACPGQLALDHIHKAAPRMLSFLCLHHTCHAACATDAKLHHTCH